MLYKFETHLHTSACSACGIATAQEMLDDAKQSGYAGVVITNHFYHGNTAIDRKLPWPEFVAAYEKDYLEAKKYGKKIGLTVLFGIEEGYAPGKEMLIYGLTPKILKSCPEFVKMTATEKVDFVRKNKGITICAHPFRNRPWIPEPYKEPDPTLFDGIECYNRGNSEYDNSLAFAFAEKYGLFKTSGGDVHQTGQLGPSGVAFKKPVKTIEGLIKLLKSGDYELVLP